MQSDGIFDIFLSHAHVDSAIVEKLGIRLEDEARLSVWFDKWVLVPGMHWQQEMAKSLDKAKCCAVCIGTQTPQGWFREETERALQRQTREPTFRVIPIILPSGNRDLVDNFLELRTWVDFKDGIDDGNAFHVLLSGIKGVPPGRYRPAPPDGETAILSIREKLTWIRQLRSEQLLDNEIAQEGQRLLLDKLIGSGSD